MVFNFEVITKINSSSKYKIEGYLEPELDDEEDKELFTQIKDSYVEIFNQNELDLNDNMTFKENCIYFSDFDVVVLSNIFKILKKNLDFDIKLNIKDDCKFIPSFCEPLAKMEIRRLF